MPSDPIEPCDGCDGSGMTDELYWDGDYVPPVKCGLCGGSGVKTDEG